jgi:enoyl-CoA hydratase
MRPDGWRVPALTGEAMDAADALAASFADALVPSERIGDLRAALADRADPGTPAEIVLLFDETSGPSRLVAARPWIDDAFAADTVAEIIARLRARPEADAVATARSRRSRPPR